MNLADTPLFSIIVPVYNVEQYINRCVDSILAQTYQNFELILVDDGSPDNSGKICDEYARKDSRIKVIHIPNGGVSNARNTGLDAASGDYIVFVDSDDWILPNHIEQLLPEGDEDWVCTGICILQNGVIIKNTKTPSSMLYKDQWISDFPGFWGQYANCSPCRCSYKTAILKKHRIQFHPDISIGEDELFNLNYIFHCNSLRYIEACTYCYDNRDTCSLMGRFHPDRLRSCHEAAAAVETITGKPEYTMRWRYWHLGLAHLKKWKKLSSAEQKKQIAAQLNSFFKDPYFRACLPYVRKNGSLDEKIETYLMTPFLHPLFPAFYKFITFPYILKRKIH